MDKIQQPGIEDCLSDSSHEMSLRKTLFPTCIALVAGSLIYYLWRIDATITAENRLIENSQVALLGLASAFHFIRSSGVSISPLAKICQRVLGLLFLSLIVREVDIDKLGDASVWRSVERIIRVIVVAAWLPLAASVFRNLRPLWNERAKILMSPCAWLTGAGVIFYMLSFFFDKSLVPILPSYSQLCEQLLQLIATICCFSGAIQSCGIPSERQILGVNSFQQSRDPACANKEAAIASNGAGSANAPSAEQRKKS